MEVMLPLSQAACRPHVAEGRECQSISVEVQAVLSLVAGYLVAGQDMPAGIIESILKLEPSGMLQHALPRLLQEPAAVPFSLRMRALQVQGAC